MNGRPKSHRAMEKAVSYAKCPWPEPLSRGQKAKWVAYKSILKTLMISADAIIGTQAFVSNRMLIEQTGLSERFIRNALHDMEANLGLITCTAHRKGGRGKAPEWRINLGHPAFPDYTVTGERLIEGGTDLDKGGTERGHGNTERGHQASIKGAPTTDKGGTNSAKGGTLCDTPSESPIEEQERSKRGRSTLAALAQGFSPEERNNIHRRFVTTWQEHHGMAAPCPYPTEKWDKRDDWEELLDNHGLDLVLSAFTLWAKDQAVEGITEQYPIDKFMRVAPAQMNRVAPLKTTGVKEKRETEAIAASKKLYDELENRSKAPAVNEVSPEDLFKE